MIRYGKQWEVLQDYFAFEETANSALWTPGSNEAWVYSKDKSGVSGLYWKNDAGTEYDLGLLTAASGAANRVAIWTSATALGSDADLTFVTDTLTATKLVVPTLATFTLAATFSFLTATRIPFAGTAGALSDDSKLNWDNTNKRLGIGTTSPTNIVEIADTVTAATRGLRVSQYSADAQFANIGGAKSRSGTIGTQASLLSDDGIVQIAAFGSDGSSFGSAQGAIQINAAENWSASAKGTYIKFANCPTGSTTTAERFRMGPSGQWGIGGATYGTALDVFTSGGASAAPTWTAPGALTKTDDTNVTLTLGGTPTTALLRAASLTLGWTGQLAVTRGGTGLNSISGDWLSQYLLLAGRSGGQIAKGGTAAGDDLQLVATASASPSGAEIRLYASTSDTRQIITATRDATIGYLQLYTQATSGQFNLEFYDATTRKWTFYKKTTNAFALFEDASSVDRLAFTANVNAISYKNSCARVYRTATQSISDATLTAINFDNEAYDTDTIHDNSTNNTRLTCQRAGKYAISGGAELDALASAGTVLIRIVLNGNAAIILAEARQGPSNSSEVLSVSTQYSLAAGDYIELFIYQDNIANTSRNTGTDTYLTHFAMAYIGE